MMTLITKNDELTLLKAMKNLRKPSLHLLLIYFPNLLAEICSKKGALLLFTSSGLLRDGGGIDLPRISLRIIPAKYWAIYLLKNKMSGCTHEKIPKPFRSTLRANSVEIHRSRDYFLTKKYKTISRDELFKIYKNSSSKIRRRINLELSLRGERALKTPRDLAKIRANILHDREIYYGKGYTLKLNSIINFLIDYKVKSFEELAKKNCYISRYLSGSRSVAMDKEENIIRIFQAKGICDFRQKRRTGPYVPTRKTFRDIADEMLIQIRKNGLSVCPNLRKFFGRDGQFVISQKKTNDVRAYIEVRLGMIRSKAVNKIMVKDEFFKFVKVMEIDIRSDVTFQSFLKNEVK